MNRQRVKRKSEKNVRFRLLLAVGAVAIAVVGGIAAYHLLLDDGVALGRRRFWFPGFISRFPDKNNHAIDACRYAFMEDAVNAGMF